MDKSKKKLIFKATGLMDEYHAVGGISLKDGDVYEFDDGMALSLLSKFPQNFEDYEKFKKKKNAIKNIEKPPVDKMVAKPESKK